VKLKVPVIVKDPEVSEFKDIRPTEDVEITSEKSFLDGPTSPRVAILDFGLKTGELSPPVKFIPPTSPTEHGGYEVHHPVEPGGRVARDATNVSVFGAIYKTIEMFEEPDAMGRRVSWAFGAPQLLVVPRAGEWANAYYERESHSLQFFYFKAQNNGVTVHTSHSQDIVAHETTHAILDGLAPDLFNAISPQSLAIHEGVADLGAVLCALRCRELSETVLKTTNYSIERSSIFSGIGEQFAGALSENRDYLRNLLNNKSLDPKAPAADRVDRSEPHDLSQVLSGALYSMLLATYEELRGVRRSPSGRHIVEPSEEEFNQRKLQRVSGTMGGIGEAMKALFLAGERLKRALFRGLDYLPPGDVTFADVGRAILAADQASHPDSEAQRDDMRREFVRRGIVPNAKELAVQTRFDVAAVQALNLDEFIESDYSAYRFVEANRALLSIPAGVTFCVRPRLCVTKLYWHRTGPEEAKEVLLKVVWTEQEANPAGGGLPDKRRWLRGTTLVIDYKTKKVHGLLTTTRGDADREDTTQMLRRLQATDMLRLDDHALGPDRRPLRSAVQGLVVDGALRLKHAGRMLHIVSTGF
jgi:hypothetical protein